MLLKDCPFLKLSKEDIPRPILPINNINPHTGLSYATFGIIDTGADECAIPAAIASILGHNLQAGSTKTIKPGMEKPLHLLIQQSLRFITLYLSR